MTMPAKQADRIGFHLEIAEYYEAAGLDRPAERERTVARHLAADYRAVADPDPEAEIEPW